MCGLRLLRSYICFATSQISLLTKQTLFIRLFVFCSFAPSPQKYKSIFWGPLKYLAMTLKRELIVCLAEFLFQKVD